MRSWREVTVGEYWGRSVAYNQGCTDDGESHFAAPHRKVKPKLGGGRHVLS